MQSLSYSTLKRVSTLLRFMNLKGKVAMVTGAGGGVGKATTQRLASEGSKVVLVGRERKKLTKGISEVNDGRNLLPNTRHIMNAVAVLNAVDEPLAVFDTLDILVHNPSVLNAPTPFHLMTD